METQSMGNEHSPLPIAGRITENKVGAILFTIFNFSISIVGAVILFRKSSGLYDGRKDVNIAAGFAATFMPILPLVSIISARALADVVTADSNSREAIMWAILKKFSGLLFAAYLLMFWVIQAYRG